jgi:CheY-like chemotaxis protein
MNEKYKLLMTGGNKVLIKDFFLQMDGIFEMLTCSRRVDDIRGHLKYYQPDAMLFCLYNETRDDMTPMNRVRELLHGVGAALIVVGDSSLCDDFERTMPMAADYVIRRNRGNANNSKLIGDLITKYLDSRALYKQAEESVKHTGMEPAETSVDDLLAAAAAAVSEMQSMPETAPEPAPVPVPGKRHHVLVVDDDSSMLRMIKEILNNDYDVATALSGKVALKFLEGRTTDVILLDYEMPIQSGAEVYQKILDNPNTKNIPVVFLTGVSDRERIADVLAMRPRGYLLKPIDSERLKKTIAEIVN